MKQSGDIFHSAGTQLQELMQGRDWSEVGEIVGVGENVGQIFLAFMGSDDHRAIILRRAYHHAATGVVRDGDRVWTTVIFWG
jgi:uncharacterized protein YkwD